MHILKADIFTLEKPDISILGLHAIFRIMYIMLNSMSGIVPYTNCMLAQLHWRD